MEKAASAAFFICTERSMQKDHSLFTAEWQTLQNNIETYERGAQTIKLSAVGLTSLLCVLDVPLFMVMAIPALLWLQEGIYRTSQVRLCERILIVESLISKGMEANEALQLHTAWQAGRAGMFGLISEYLANSLRPTVAFPYPILILLGCLIDQFLG
jgi:hypothetical protein